ncbi:hypothetical protein NE237_029995 [Protea cynaroides]|uniref:F-box protein n=1 Tax=Protea cynaroides TaxID=273540 RepID=A0A9Q0JWS9_9MAGN|nr:hypothetical protein NE237_029995 [Protea cynaroides]
MQVYDNYGRYGIYFIYMEEGEFITKVKLMIKDKFFIERNTDDCKGIRVVNPVTKQYLKLPHHQPCSSSYLSGYHPCSSNFSKVHHGFAFVSSIGKFKVKVIYAEHDSQDYGNVECVILTSDCSNPKWRVIEGPPRVLNSVSDGPIQLMVTCIGVLYIKMMLELGRDEIEGHLSNSVIQPNGVVDIWILKDIIHGGQWVKQYSIICPFLLENPYRCIKVLSLRSEEITVFDYGFDRYGDKMLYVFDVKLNKLKMMNKINKFRFCSPHFNSNILMDLG